MNVPFILQNLLMLLPFYYKQAIESLQNYGVEQQVQYGNIFNASLWCYGY